MRIVGILFFALLAAQIALRYFSPTPMPFWVKIAVIVTAVGMIDCLVIPPVIDWARRRKARDSRPPPGTSDK